MTAWSYAAMSRCWGCGRDVAHRPFGGPHRWHACALRWLSRQRWRAYLDGWHEAHRFAVEHPNDPMVLADADDYGTGWAGLMRVGHITVSADAVLGEDQP